MVPELIQVPEKVAQAFHSVVRIRPRNIRFRRTLFDTVEAASAARKLPHARDKEFSDDGTIVWPVFLVRAELEKICSETSVYANRGAAGYYRSLYGSDELRSLAASAESRLAPSERLNLVNDAWAAVRSGFNDIGDFLPW